jgi:hypothetical protein
VAWIKFDKDLVDDPRIISAAEALAERYTLSVERKQWPGVASSGSDVDERETVTLMRNAVMGGLVTLWVYADTHLRNGDELPISMASIDRMVGIDNFCELVGEDWITSENYGTTVILPGYSEKNGLISKDKRNSAAAERQRRFREKRKALSNATSNPVANAVSNAVTRNAVTALDQDLDQDQKKETKEVALQLPEWLPADAWKAYLEVRKQKKTPNTPRALNMLITELTRLKSLGFDPAAVLDQSTLKGWKSVFPTKPELVAVNAEPKAQLCDYCTKESQGTVNGRRACTGHWQLAMDNERPALKVAI